VTTATTTDTSAVQKLLAPENFKSFYETSRN